MILYGDDIPFVTAPDRILDDTDRDILRVLQENARTPNAEIARRIGMAPSAVFERLRKLEARGVIRGYELRLDAGALGLGLAAFVFVRGDDLARGTAMGEALAAVPEVLEVHHIAGEDCYLVKVRVADTEALGRLLHERIGTVPGVRSTRTTVVLSTRKETGSIALPIAGEGRYAEAADD
jgi:Lrp/AsnC family leucine-responsive transcriptional regulator